MTQFDLSTAQQFNAIAFALHNHLVNENGSPIEFTDHKFLIDPYMDNSPRQVVKKAGQVGWSTLAVLRAFHLAYYQQANIIYTLPSKSVVKDFVTPKVDPLIENNPAIKKLIGATDSLALKAVGKRFVYFRGSWEESSAISISAHILVNDETDRSNQKVLSTYKTRLDDAKRERPDLGWVWQFSNPSMPNHGVDVSWQTSDQKHWLIKCSHCNHYQALAFPDNIDIEHKCYICSRCHRLLETADRLNGRWVKKRLGADVSGYHISQMMCAWHPAAKIIEDSEGDQATFHNFTLGEPYVSKDQSITRETILACLIPNYNPRTQVAIGVDNGVVKHYVVGNRYGIFKVGATESWEEIEGLRNQYGAVMVIDANPYPTMPKRLAEKYRGKVFIHYYEDDKKQLGIVRWGEGDNFGVVKSDRTKLIDSVVADLASQEIIFNLTQTDLEDTDYIKHWLNMYRTVETTAQGIQKAVWRNDDRPDHYGHASCLWRVALLKTLSQGGVVTPRPATEPVFNPAPRPDNTIPAPDLGQIVERAVNPQRSRVIGGS